MFGLVCFCECLVVVGWEFDLVFVGCVWYMVECM